jgi:hypothetical protein
VRRAMMRVLACVAVGVVATYGVAVGVVAAVDPYELETLQAQDCAWMRSANAAYASVSHDMLVEGELLDVRAQATRLQTEISELDFQPIEEIGCGTGEPYDTYHWTFVRAGWPWTALEGWSVRHSSWTTAGRGVGETTRSRIVEVRDLELPIGPVWPGVVGSVALYGGVAWLLSFLPGMVRARLRLRRGTCPSCGYDLRSGGQAACPECGGGA